MPSAVLAAFRAIIRRLSDEDLAALRGRFVALHEHEVVVMGVIENRGGRVP